MLPQTRVRVCAFRLNGFECTGYVAFKPFCGALTTALDTAGISRCVNAMRQRLISNVLLCHRNQPTKRRSQRQRLVATPDNIKAIMRACATNIPMANLTLCTRRNCNTVAGSACDTLRNGKPSGGVGYDLEEDTCPRTRSFELNSVNTHFRTAHTVNWRADATDVVSDVNGRSGTRAYTNCVTN